MTFREKLSCWLRGAATVLVLFPDTEARLRKRFLGRSDAEALAGDWQAVGADLRKAIGQWEAENPDLARRPGDGPPAVNPP